MADNFQSANLRKKVLAILVDYGICFIILLFCIVVMLLFCMLSEILTNKDIEFNATAAQIISLIGLVLFIILYYLYYSHSFKKIGQTLGEKVAGIQVIPQNKERISLSAGVKRCLFLIPPFVIFYFINKSVLPPISFFEHFTGTVLIRKPSQS